MKRSTNPRFHKNFKPESSQFCLDSFYCAFWNYFSAAAARNSIHSLLKSSLMTRHPTIICRGFSLAKKKKNLERKLFNIVQHFFHVIFLCSSTQLLHPFFSHSADSSEAERAKNVIEIWAAADSLRWLQPARETIVQLNLFFFLFSVARGILAKIKKAPKNRRKIIKCKCHLSPTARSLLKLCNNLHGLWIFHCSSRRSFGGAN